MWKSAGRVWGDCALSEDLVWLFRNSVGVRACLISPVRLGRVDSGVRCLGGVCSSIDGFDNIQQRTVARATRKRYVFYNSPLLSLIADNGTAAD